MVLLVKETLKPLPLFDHTLGVDTVFGEQIQSPTPMHNGQNG